MINGHLNDAGYATHLTQIASYFDIVDSAVKTADTNKRYSMSTNVSTAPSPPIQANSWTHVHIAPTCDNMCDLYNSYIVADMEIEINPIKSPAASADNFDNPPSAWIGFKDSLHAISQYQIISNGVSVYDQSHAIEESYITSLATPDTVIERDVFSKCSMKGIHKRPDCLMTGAIVDLTKSSQKVTISLKIDIRRFLPLSPVKYLPAFVGNLELRLKFSTDGLVWCPMPYTDLMVNPSKRNGIILLPTIGTCFRPLSENQKVYVSCAKTTVAACADGSKPEVYKIVAGTAHLEVKQMCISKCYSILACFGIDDGIYQSLIQRYSGQSLSFPTQTLSFHQTDGPFTFDAGSGHDKEGKFNLAITITPRFVDTIFFLFPHKPNHRTCYYNPMFKEVRLYMGGYGTMPDQAMSSYGMQSYEMTQNALNMNNDAVGLNEGVMRSMIVSDRIRTTQQLEGYEANDVSNYVLAFPTSVDNTFQQGQTSSSPITYELKGTFHPNSMFCVQDGSQCVPMIGLLKDSVLAIQIRPTGPPIIALDEFDIASPSGA